MSCDSIPENFFAKDAVTLARDLLGQILVRRIGRKILAGRIVETEAYVGLADRASHAFGGKRVRNAPMFDAPGTIYVYFIYGKNWCFNVVCGTVGQPDAVLVRALEPLIGLAEMQKNRGGTALKNLANGPGKLCQALAIDGKFNCRSLIGNSQIFIAQGLPLPDSQIVATARIGLGEKCAEWRDRPLRFLISGNPHVSRRIRLPSVAKNC